MDATGISSADRLLDGRYRVGAVIARGGMSVVHRGVDTRLDRPVAIKIMHPGYAADQSFADRFEREARLAAGLHHRGVVAVYDQGRDGDTAFLIMELVDGGTLRDLISERGPLPVSLALSILEPLLGALAAAHSAGLVHRDVKPENVLISSRGEVKVADFGLVRAISSQSSATGDVILGTVAYLSPEQVATGAADARSDVYAAGVLAFELVTGHTPYTGDNAISIAYQHVHGDVPPVTDEAPGVPVELADVLLAATRRDPAARPRDAGAFLAALIGVRARIGMRRVPVPVPRLRHLHRPAADVPLRPTPRPAPAPAGPAGTTAVVSPTGTSRPSPTRQAARRRTGVLPTEAGRPRPSAHPAGRGASRHRPGRGWLVAIVVVVVLGVLAAAGGWWLGGRWAYAPQSVGEYGGSAAQQVRAAGLVPELTSAPNDTTPTGQVSSSDPAGGSRMLKGSSVRLVVSTGRPQVPVLTTGMASADAAALVAAAHLTARMSGGTDEWDDSVPAGALLRSNPPAGAVLVIAAPVTLVRSLGPRPTEVPQVALKSVIDADNALTATGFTLGPTTTRFSADADPGLVVATVPGAGSTAPHGSAVSLVVAVALAVPDVRDESSDDAAAVLTYAGFVVRYGPTAFDPAVPAGSVATVDPPPGSRVDPAGAMVTLTLSNAVDVPLVVGQRVDTAVQTLASAGLTAAVEQTLTGTGSIVLEQDPAVGGRVAPGAPVRLYVFP